MRAALGQRRAAGAAEWWPRTLALAVFAAALWAQADALVGVFYDDGVYVALAKALAEGEGYRNIHLPQAPPAVHYPILYPFVLSLAWRLWPSFPANTALFELLDAAFLAGAAWIVARHAMRWSSRWARFAMLPAGFLAYPLLAAVGVRFSEPLFLFLLAGAVCVADRTSVSPRVAFAAGLLAALAALTRSIGLAAVAGIPLSLWLRGARRGAVWALVPAALMLTPWFLWVAVRGSEIDPRIAANYGTYGQYVAQAGLGALIAGLDLSGFAPLARLILPPLPAALWLPAAITVVALALWGAVKSYGRAPALVLTLLFYGAVVTLWPFAPDRFVWIVLPWIFLFLAAGGADLAARGRAGRVAVAVVVLLALAGYGRTEAISLWNRGFSASAEGISRTLGWVVPPVVAETPPDAVIASPDEALIYLYTGRRAVPAYLFRREGREANVPILQHEAREFLCQSGVTHAVVSGPGADEAAVVAGLGRRPDVSLQPVFSITDGAALYRFRCRD